MTRDIGQIQAWLDNELPLEQHQELERFFERDPQFQEEVGLFQCLEQDLAETMANAMKPKPTDVDVDAAWKRFQVETLPNASPKEARETANIASSLTLSTSATPHPTEGQGAWWRRWFGWGGLTLATAFACAAVLVVLPSQQTATTRSSPSTLTKNPMNPSWGTMKGSNIEMYYSCGTGHGSLHRCQAREGSRLFPGTLVQFSYELAQETHLMIVSINQKGEISAFVPLGGQQSVAVTAGKGTLPARESLELDDYLGKERIFLLTSTQSFPLNQVKAQLQKAFEANGRQLENLRHCPGPWRSQTILLEKHSKTTLTP